MLDIFVIHKRTKTRHAFCCTGCRFHKDEFKAMRVTCYINFSRKKDIYNGVDDVILLNVQDYTILITPEYHLDNYQGE